MLRIILLPFALLFTTLAINAQSISYTLGYGLPISEEFDIYETYKRNSEFIFAIGFSNNKKEEFTQIRFTTFNASKLFRIGDDFNQSESYISVRKYVVELQNYFYNLNLKKLGSINFGSKISFLIRSDVSGYSNFTSTTPMDISSFDYERQSKFYASLLARYAIKPIKLSSRFSFQPSYTYSYSLNNNIRSNTVNTKLVSHIFELSLISLLSDKKKK